MCPLLLWNENDGQYDGRSLMLAESSLGTDLDEYRAIISLAARLVIWHGDISITLEHRST